MAKRKRRQAENPALNLPLLDIVGSTIITTHGHYVRAFRLRGMDSEHLPSGILEQTANSLYRDLITQLPEGCFVQVLMNSHGNYDDIFERYERISKGKNDVLDFQREQRIQHLRKLNLRRHSIYAFVGYTDGFTSTEFADISEEQHEEKLEELAILAKSAEGMFDIAGLTATEMQEQEIKNLYWQLLNPDLEQPRRKEAKHKNNAHLSAEKNLSPNPTCHYQSIREQLVKSDWQWDEDYLKIGKTYHRTMTLRDLPPETQFTDAEQWYSLGFDFWVSLTFQIPNQSGHQKLLNQQRRIGQALAGDGTGVENYAKTIKAEEQEELAELLERTGQRLMKVCCQIVVTAGLLSDLDKRLRELEDRARSRQYNYYSERTAHDQQLIKTLPGMGVYSERYLLVTSNNVADMTPIFQEQHGDATPALLLRTPRDELYSYDPVEDLRENGNFTMFGGSGSGKTVFMNLLISHCFLSGPSAGQLMVIDHAGSERSTYKRLAELFGGQYVPVVSEQGGLNPFPKPKEALDENGRVLGNVESFLTTILDLLLSNVGRTKDEQLYRIVMQKGICEMYRAFVAHNISRAPTMNDLLEILYKLRDKKQIDQERLFILVELLGGFLESATSDLFCRESKASPDNDFLILDLHGIDGMQKEMKEAVVFITTSWCKQMAFNPENPGRKYIVLDEVAQLIRQQEMVHLVHELYSTARKHNTVVGTITQLYSSYRESALAPVVKSNAASQFFLNCAKDEEARKLVQQDYGFNEREAFLYENLRTVKRRYSEALLQTVIRDPDTDDTENISTVIKIDLSPLDYQICTSDPSDRELQRRYIDANPDRSLKEILQHIAENKSRLKVGKGEAA